MWLAAGATAALGVSGMLAFGGSATAALPFLVGAAVLGAGGVLVLVAGGWLEPLWLIVVSLPLPALYASEGARLSPIVFVSVVVLLGWAFRRGFDRRPIVPEVAAARPMIVVTLAILVAAVFAEDPASAAREVVNFALLLGLFLLTLDQVAQRPERAHVVARWIAIGAAAAGAAAVPEALGLLPARFRLPGTGWFRAAGGFGWPNELAMFLAVSLPFAVHAVRTAHGAAARWASVAGLCLAAAGLAATFSRGSWLAVGLAPAVLVLTGDGRVALRFWAVALAGALAVDLAAGGAITARIAGTAGDVLVAQRLLLTVAGLLMFQANPILGIGPGGFGEGLLEVGLLIPGLFDFVDSAQNGYVHMAAEAGVIGLAALLYFVVATFRALLRSARAGRGDAHVDAREALLRSAVLWSFATACVVALFEWPFAHGIGELIVVGAAVGIALSAPFARAR